MSYKKKNMSSNMTYLMSEDVNDPAGLLAAQIVIHAVEDWRQIIMTKSWDDPNPSKYCNFDELRLFFNGEWCAFLLQGFSIKPAAIIELLEKELEEAKKGR